MLGSLSLTVFHKTFTLYISLTTFLIIHTFHFEGVQNMNLAFLGQKKYADCSKATVGFRTKFEVMY